MTETTYCGLARCIPGQLCEDCQAKQEPVTKPSKPPPKPKKPKKD